MRFFSINQVGAANREDSLDTTVEPRVVGGEITCAESEFFVDTADMDRATPDKGTVDSKRSIATKRLHDRLFYEKDAAALPEWVEYFDEWVLRESRFTIAEQSWPTYVNGSANDDAESLAAIGRAEVFRIGKNLRDKPGQKPLEFSTTYVKLRVGNVMMKQHKSWREDYLKEQSLKQLRQDGEVDTPSIECADYGTAMVDARDTVLSICESSEDLALIKASFRVRSDATFTTEVARLTAIAKEVDSTSYRVEKRLNALYEAIQRGSRDNASHRFKALATAGVSGAGSTESQRVA